MAPWSLLIFMVRKTQKEQEPLNSVGTHVHLLGVMFFRYLSSVSQTSSIQSGAELSRSRDFTSYGSRGILPSHTSASIPRDRCTSSFMIPTCSASLTSPWWVLRLLYLGICVCVAHRGQKSVSDPLELELTDGCEHPDMAIRSRTQTLCKNSKSS